ncbi:hypothetical protein QJS10_CPB19g00338 [Acorus calamus]|uniref:Uncharacterized protein n=1 Tax=Acorus calamus TaxID=4465 RepID=A0AAV9CI95_ACOCL|nr:hypothetical protein QJS10_CPB19g00338 [Acorus calamus]
MSPTDDGAKRPEAAEELLEESTVDPGYIISLIRGLLPPRDCVGGGLPGRDEPSAAEEGGDPWDDGGCVLWDLAASKCHAEFMVKNLLLEVLSLILPVSKSVRVTGNNKKYANYQFTTTKTKEEKIATLPSSKGKICLGIIANLACHGSLNDAVASTNGGASQGSGRDLPAAQCYRQLSDVKSPSKIYMWLFLLNKILSKGDVEMIQLGMGEKVNAQQMSEWEWFKTEGILSLGLQSSASNSWVGALQHEHIAERVIWIVGNTLNYQLLEKVKEGILELLLAVIESQDGGPVLLPLLIKLGLGNHFVGLLTSELSKIREERSFDGLIFYVEKLGATEATQRLPLELPLQVDYVIPNTKPRPNMASQPPKDSHLLV